MLSRGLIGQKRQGVDWRGQPRQHKPPAQGRAPPMCKDLMIRRESNPQHTIHSICITLGTTNTRQAAARSQRGCAYCAQPATRSGPRQLAVLLQRAYHHCKCTRRACAWAISALEPLLRGRFWATAQKAATNPTPCHSQCYTHVVYTSKAHLPSVVRAN